MCNRYTLEKKIFDEHLAQMNQSLHEELENEIIRPTNQVPIAMLANKKLELHFSRWWLIPSWFKGNMKDWKAATFNARIETAREKPAFREAWRNGRCLVPASSYFEFTGDTSPKQAWEIRPQTNTDFFWMAGLYTKWNGLITNTIVTRSPNPDIAQIHDRQPAILTESETDIWLEGGDIDGALWPMIFEKYN